MKKLFSLSIFIFFFLSNFVFTVPLVYANVPSDSGFIPGQIWYSKDSLVSGETVKIYTAVWNGTTSAVSFRVDFYDKDVLLGFRDVLIPSDALSDVSISWKVTDGDHLISAKIISSSVTTAGKKENIDIGNNATSVDHQFVSVVIKKADGTVATSADVVKSQVDKLGSQIKDVLPASVSIPDTSSFESVDAIRVNALGSVVTMKANTQKQLDTLNKPTKTNTKSATTTNGVEKPIAYVKLFFLSILHFILEYAIIYYSLILVILFYILRYIYRKIRDR